MLQLNKIISLLLLICSIAFTSCDSKQLYDEYVSLENGWGIDQNLKFSFDKPTEENNCNLFFNIISNNDYRFNNIFVIASITNPVGIVHVDTLEYTLADPEGNLLGKGIMDHKELKLWYKQNYFFDKEGTYTVNLQQAVRQQNKINGIERLNGISKIGFRIESTSNN